MLQVTVTQLEGNEAVWKPTTKNAVLYKTNMLLVQFPGSPTNISQLQKKPKTSKWVCSKVFWSIL